MLYFWYRGVFTVLPCYYLTHMPLKFLFKHAQTKAATMQPFCSFKVSHTMQ